MRLYFHRKHLREPGPERDVLPLSPMGSPDLLQIIASSSRASPSRCRIRA